MKTTDSLPKISVITVVYNDELNIEKTIKSVLNQTYTNIEYIIINGNSKDKTDTIVKKYISEINIYINENDKGIYDAMNKGILLSTGEWIIFMNSNDTFYNNNVIEDVFKIDYTGYDVIYGTAAISSKVGYFKPRNLNSFWVGMPFNHQSSFLNCVTHKNNLFNLSYRVSAVYDFFYSLYSQNSKFYRVDNIIANYDLTGISHYSYEWLWDYWRINLKYSKHKLHLVFFKLLIYFLSRVKTNINRLK
jgi:glycosyltransferase involved in cell wall biosynthesis